MNAYMKSLFLCRRGGLVIKPGDLSPGKDNPKNLRPLGRSKLLAI